MAWGRPLCPVPNSEPVSSAYRCLCEAVPNASLVSTSVRGLNGRPVPPNLLSSMPLHCLCDSWGIKEVDSHTLLSHHLLSCPQVSTTLLAMKPGHPPSYFPAAAQQCEQQTPEVSSPRGSKLCPVQAAEGLGEKDRKIRVGRVWPEPHPHPSTPGRQCILTCF